VWTRRRADQSGMFVHQAASGPTGPLLIPGRRALGSAAAGCQKSNALRGPSGVAILSSTREAPQECGLQVEREKGFEPSTSTLARRRSRRFCP
jgi:hypothetical protein